VKEDLAMGNRLKGKVAIVTGAGSTPGEGIGNGKATAVVYAREGASVMLVDLRVDAAKETKEMIEKEGGKCFVFQADVSQSQDCKSMAAECVETYGKIDILHNNVGIGQRPYGGPLDVEEATWDRVINVNLKSMFLTSRAVLPQMLKHGKGVILNISSVAASIHVSPHLVYGVSKAGVNTLTRYFAVHYAEKGIRVNAIMPGLMDTPMIEAQKIIYGGDIAKMKKTRNERPPMKRMGEAWDVAYASLFLVSDEAKYITGQVLAVDGGLTCKDFMGQ
jgi:NAD(P)-dependent dehydrogenase (short-subunit alcohol dehydrogenase family)